MGNRSSTNPGSARLCACPECDLLQRMAPVAAGTTMRCARCGAVLARPVVDPIGRPLALTVTAAIVFIVACTTPLMGMSAVGRHTSTTIIGGAWAMWQRGEPITGALVLFCAVVAPALFIVLILALLFVLGRRRPVPHRYSGVLSWAMHMHPWTMFEVMLLGILVALIKIADLATVGPGPGMFAMGALALLFPALIVSLDVDEMWRRIEWSDGRVHDAGTQAES